MTYLEAIDSTVSALEAINECRKHGIIADHDGRELFDAKTGETIAIADPYGEFSGGDVLAWLGY